MGKDSFAFNVQRKKTPFQVKQGRTAVLHANEVEHLLTVCANTFALTQRHKELEEDKKRVRRHGPILHAHARSIATDIAEGPAVYYNLVTTNSQGLPRCAAG